LHNTTIKLAYEQHKRIAPAACSLDQAYGNKN
jgi:hypothetical protein